MTLPDFTAKLRSELLHRGLRFVTAAIGRLHGAAVWVVTCHDPDGRLVCVHVPVDAPNGPGKVSRCDHGEAGAS